MRRVLRDPVVGSLLIQSDDKSGEAILLHSMLPISIRERHRAEETWVFLLDAQVRPSSILFGSLTHSCDREYR
jgi:uridine kinase